MGSQQQMTYLLTSRNWKKVSENTSYSYTLRSINIVHICIQRFAMFPNRYLFGSLCTTSALYGSRIKPQLGQSVYAIVFENWFTNIFLRYFLLFSIYVSSSLYICTQFLKCSSLKYRVWWTWFFSLFQTWILQATAGRKIQFKLGKKSSSSNSIFQTWELQKASADR